MKTKAGIEKPLAEWTVQEIKDFCEHNRPCIDDDCQLLGICGATDVSVWDLSEKPKFTEQEIRDAKTIMQILGFKSADARINRVGGGLVITIKRGNFTDGICINEKLFPSLEKGRIYSFSEIIGDADA